MTEEAFSRATVGTCTRATSPPTITLLQGPVSHIMFDRLDSHHARCFLQRELKGPNLPCMCTCMYIRFRPRYWSS